MISQERYNKLKSEYGKIASWAIWKEPGDTPKSNTSDLSAFQDSNLLETLNPNYVFVGLNASSTHPDYLGAESWFNFHSAYSRQNDYKLRYALMGTKYWGSYITDVIKYYPEVDSNKVRQFLKQNPDVVKRNIGIFEEEIGILSDKPPVLIAMGGETYRLLKDNLKDIYEIKCIKHYSYTIGKEAYREEVIGVLDK